ncbi:amidohydrolase family protein [Thermorudis peleae]|uniref:amidohydrolase family protein n=1 Tax=Thermorudis peleae TaxID=1382356 RepID=UPI0005717724|nr:amidohydrolase family protein [Thermorudis peleae]
MIIDSHVHIFPPEVVAHRDTYCERDPWFGALYATERARIATLEDLLTAMDGAGIDCAIACGFPWHDPGLCAWHNEYLADAAQRSNGRVAWLGIVVPGTTTAAAEAERCFLCGAVGIGELNADAQGFAFDDQKAFAPLVDVCRAFSRPLLFHVSEPLGHQYPGKGNAWPQRFISFLEAFPGQPVIAAHWGGGLPFYELMPEVAELTRQVVYDSAASTYLYRFRVFRAVVDLVGADRVLFASDYPVLRQDRFLRRVLEVELTEQERALILGQNALRVFRLAEAAR